LRMADIGLGSGYLTAVPSGEDGVRTTVAVAGDDVVGFCIHATEPPGWLRSPPKNRRIHMPNKVVELDDAGRLGTIRTVVVDPAYRGRGIASTLVAEAERRLTDSGVSVIASTGWTTADGTHIGGVLTRLGYWEMPRVEGFWTDESI